MISVVTVYNDAPRFESMLRLSLGRQHEAFELIALDNTSARFPSAARALNEGGRRATGDFLFFAHQDVAFDSPSWLSDAERMLADLPALGIAGVAGARAGPVGQEGRERQEGQEGRVGQEVAQPFRAAGDKRATANEPRATSHEQREEGRVIVSNLEDSWPPQRNQHVALRAPEIVDTVDECAFFIPRSVFERAGFDESTCDGWHLYAVDFSLTVRAAGLRAYALPLPLYHHSGGAVVRFMGIATYEQAYFRTLRKVLRKHPSVDPIRTTCGAWSARRSLTLQRFPPAVVRAAVRSWLRERLGLSPFGSRL